MIGNGPANGVKGLSNTLDVKIEDGILPLTALTQAVNLISLVFLKRRLRGFTIDTISTYVITIAKIRMVDRHRKGDLNFYIRYKLAQFLLYLKYL